MQTSVFENRENGTVIDYNKIKAVVLDVDGTLTDGSIYYDNFGNELKTFSVKDGLGIKVALAAGLDFIILTGRKSEIVTRRVNELGIQHLYEGVQKKYPKLCEISENLQVSFEEICYIGDDLNDLYCMQQVGLAMCPCDAAEEVKIVCDYVSSKQGGLGAVRDCLEELLKNKGCWKSNYEQLYVR